MMAARLSEKDPGVKLFELLSACRSCRCCCCISSSRRERRRKATTQEVATMKTEERQQQTKTASSTRPSARARDPLLARKLYTNSYSRMVRRAFLYGFKKRRACPATSERLYVGFYVALVLKRRERLFVRV